MGVQSHLSGNPQGGILLNRLDRIATAGLPIFVTELDYVNADVNIRAQILEDALTAYFRYTLSKAITIISFCGLFERRKGCSVIFYSQKSNGVISKLLDHQLFDFSLCHMTSHL